MDRRTAMKAVAGFLTAPAALLFPKKAKAVDRTITIPVRLDTSDLRQRFDDQMGISPKPSGVAGVTYFKAGDRHWPDDAYLYLDGKDVTVHATECDLVGGWAVLLDHDGNGGRVHPIRARLHRGELEIKRF